MAGEATSRPHPVKSRVVDSPLLRYRGADVIEGHAVKDLDVRVALRQRLASEHAGEDDTLIVEEMGVWSGSVRVDIAVVNGQLHGFEIKSARDTLKRLPQQEQLYSQVFDRVTLVVADCHVAKAVPIIPVWWGIISATGVGAVSLIDRREGTRNPAPSALQAARLLWRDELIAVLAENGALKGYKRATSERLCQRLCEALPQDAVRLAVRSRLKARSNWSRKPIDNERDMSICSNLDPLSSAAS